MIFKNICKVVPSASKKNFQLLVEGLLEKKAKKDDLKARITFKKIVLIDCA